MDEQIENRIAVAVDACVFQYGDQVVITVGLPLQATGTTTMLRVYTITDNIR